MASLCGTRKSFATVSELTLIFASSNAHKAKELSALLDQKIFELTPASLALEVKEDTGTFQGNALLKATAYFQQFKLPVVADDSGLVVEAMPNDLGVESANFGGPGLSGKERSLLVLEKMKAIPKEKRGAYFVCHLCFYLSTTEIYFFEGRVKGSIGFEYRGEGGFGYDPIFVPEKGKPGLTLAEQEEWKNLNSHRAMAASSANAFFRNGFANFRKFN